MKQFIKTYLSHTEYLIFKFCGLLLMMTIMLIWMSPMDFLPFVIGYVISDPLWYYLMVYKKIS